MFEMAYLDFLYEITSDHGRLKKYKHIKQVLVDNLYLKKSRATPRNINHLSLVLTLNWYCGDCF